MCWNIVKNSQTVSFVNGLELQLGTLVISYFPEVFMYLLSN